jgi:hypothetical protein
MRTVLTNRKLTRDVHPLPCFEHMKLKQKRAGRKMVEVDIRRATLSICGPFLAVGQAVVLPCQQTVHKVKRPRNSDIDSIDTGMGK